MKKEINEWFGGRIGRLEYFLALIIFSSITNILLFLGSPFFSFLFYLIFFSKIIIERMNDIGWKIKWYFNLLALAIITILGFVLAGFSFVLSIAVFLLLAVFGLALCLKKGQAKENEFGPVPILSRKKKIGLIIGAISLFVLLTIIRTILAMG